MAREFANTAVSALHAEGFGHDGPDVDWQARVHRHSLGWVCLCTRQGELVGFVNVVGRRGPRVHRRHRGGRRARHRGIGTGLIAAAAAHARATGCNWLHVDFEDRLRAFYFGACGFRPTMTGLIALTGGGG